MRPIPPGLIPFVIAFRFIADQQRGLFSYIHPGLMILVVVPSLYVGSYLLLVEQRPLRFMSGPGPWPHVLHYRIGGCLAEYAYAPLHRLDRQIRPTYWQGCVVVPADMPFE